MTRKTTQTIDVTDAPLVRQQAQPSSLTYHHPHSIQDALDFATIMVDSGLVPQVSKMQRDKAIPAVFALMAYGAEFGFSPVRSLQVLSTINGKMGISADGLAALVLSSPLCEYLRCVEQTDARATWCTKRIGEPERTFTFTLEDAERAGLLRKGSPWETYRGRMLSARAKAFLCRDVYPDIAGGMYTMEELRSLDDAPERSQERDEYRPASTYRQADASSPTAAQTQEQPQTKSATLTDDERQRATDAGEVAIEVLHGITGWDREKARAFLLRNMRAIQERGPYTAEVIREAFDAAEASDEVQHAAAEREERADTEPPAMMDADLF